MSNAFQFKQSWLEDVMASDLAPAAKVFAFGIFQHMYGNKVEAFPGTEALERTTGLSRSKFPTYRKALFEAGFLTGTVIKGRNYTYTLSDMYLEGTSTCTQKEHDMFLEGTTHVPTGDTNTTSNTSMKTTRESNNKTPSADAPVVPTSPNVEVREEPEEKVVTTSPNVDSRDAAQAAAKEAQQEKAQAYMRAKREEEEARQAELRKEWDEW